MRIIEDIYRGDLVVHFRVYTRVIMKTLMEFNRRYIAKKLVFAMFELPLGLIWKGGGSLISSVNLVQTVPIESELKVRQKERVPS